MSKRNQTLELRHLTDILIHLRRRPSCGSQRMHAADSTIQRTSSWCSALQCKQYGKLLDIQYMKLDYRHFCKCDNAAKSRQYCDVTICIECLTFWFVITTRV